MSIDFWSDHDYQRPWRLDDDNGVSKEFKIIEQYAVDYCEKLVPLITKLLDKKELKSDQFIITYPKRNITYVS